MLAALKTRSLSRLISASETRAGTMPPAGVAFVNHPQGVPSHYRRYMVKQLRERLGIPYAPMRLYLKGRKRR